jgi:hypothetical protein
VEGLADERGGHGRVLGDHELSFYPASAGHHGARPTIIFWLD